MPKKRSPSASGKPAPATLPQAARAPQPAAAPASPAVAAAASSSASAAAATSPSSPASGGLPAGAAAAAVPASAAPKAAPGGGLAAAGAARGAAAASAAAPAASAGTGTGAAAAAREDGEVEAAAALLGALRVEGGAAAAATLAPSPASASPPAATAAGKERPRASLPAPGSPAMRLVEQISKANRVVFMVGAGVSTAAGIPDFRTPGTGLFSQLKARGLPNPEAVFSIDFFQRNPEPFYKLCAEIWPTNFKPTKTHVFMKVMERKGKLVRVFTQNIDSLEHLAGLPKEKVVAAHGNFDSASCIVTRKPVPVEDVERAVKGHMTWAELHDKHKVVRVKPDIVFYGEALPRAFFACASSDMPSCDLLIVAGTSLQVFPFAGLVEDVHHTCPRVLVNRERVGPFSAGRGRSSSGGNSGRDVFVPGDCDEVFAQVAEALGWGDDLHQELELLHRAAVARS